MPKKQSQETPEDQSERFRREVQKLIDAGELSPIEANAALDKLVSKQGTHGGGDNGRAK